MDNWNHVFTAGADPDGLSRGANSWRARSASLTRGLGALPQWGSGAKHLVRGSEGFAPEANEISET